MKSSEKTFLFYDIETTGLNPCFDQILQFAAIRTDSQLNELERHEFMIRLNPDVIMSPESLITHRIGIQQILAGDKEYNVIHRIHQLINTPGTISVGYNSLNFDDEFLRFAFFRNLLPPYTHQYANQCSRLDLYPITILYFLHKPEALIWPEINNTVSLKLENLSKINGLSGGQAHNAMVDVIATLNLAKQFYQFPDMWHYSLGYFDKNTDLNRQEKMSSELLIADKTYKMAIMIKGNLGSRLYYQAPVIKLGQHNHYKNQTIWLRLDSENLTQTTLDSMAAQTTIIRKKAGEQALLLPLIDQYDRYLCPSRKQLLLKNQTWLQQHPSIWQAICDYHLNYQYPTYPNVDIDAALYSLDFPSRYVESLCAKFHQPHTTLEEKLNLITLFPDPIKQQQGRRLIARNFLSEIPQEQQAFFKQSLTPSPDTTDYRGQPRLSIDTALQHSSKLLAGNTLDREQQLLLQAYQRYLTTLTTVVTIHSLRETATTI